MIIRVRAGALGRGVELFSDPHYEYIVFRDNTIEVIAADGTSARREVRMDGRKAVLPELAD